jgi:hypothetical protein
MENGADRNWIGWDNLTALDAAERHGANELAAWLRERGTRSSSEHSNAFLFVRRIRRRRVTHRRRRI